MEDVLGSLVASLIAGAIPYLGWTTAIVVFWIAFLMPLPGRGPGFAKRDPWRTYRFQPRAQAFERAQGRCEAPRFFAWGRCTDAATEVDHIYPWSRGGATVLSNAQALCRGHNRSKGALTPPWWYVYGLETRRRTYFPASESVRVHARATAEEFARRSPARKAPATDQ